MSEILHSRLDHPLERQITEAEYGLISEQATPGLPLATTHFRKPEIGACIQCVWTARMGIGKPLVFPLLQG